LGIPTRVGATANRYYLRQEAEIDRLKDHHRGLVLLTSHGYLTSPIPGDANPHLLIIDERPSDFLTPDAPLTLTVGELGGGMQPRAKSSARSADAFADLHRMIRPLADAIWEATFERPGRELELLRALGWTAEKCRDAYAALSQFAERRLADLCATELQQHDVARSMGMPDDLEARLERALKSAPLSRLREHQRLFEAVALELESDRADFTAIWRGERRATTEDGSEIREPALMFTYLRRLRASPSTPLLHLDGTGHPDLARAMFGALQHHHIPVQRGDSAIVQVVGKGFSAQSITGVGADGREWYPENARRLRGHLTDAIAEYPGAFVAANKRVLEALSLGCVTGHFGALRGLNRAEGCPVAIVIGRELPPPDKLEVKGRAIAARLRRSFQSLAGAPWPKHHRRLRTRDGSRHMVEIEYHPDATTNAVLEQVREAEIVQAIDRVRPIWNHRSIFILGNVAGDATVDRVVTWREWRRGGTKLERTARSGVVLLSPSELARCFPAIWKNREAVHRDSAMPPLIRSAEHASPGTPSWCDVSQIESLFRGCHTKRGGLGGACLVEYRCQPVGTGRGRATPWHRAIVAGPTLTARSNVETITGPLADFRTIVELAFASGGAGERSTGLSRRVHRGRAG
jgi:hypothetical protein